MELNSISEGKYKFKNVKIDGGAFSKIYNLDKKNCKDKKYIVKIHNRKSKLEAINEIDILLKLKKNKTNFKAFIKSVNLDNKYLKSKLAKIKDYYITDDYIYTIFKKYNITLDAFNIQYNQEFKETIPISLIKKITNSLFLGLHELKMSEIIHCDIKPNNILIELIHYKSIKDLFKDIKNKKIKRDELINFIDIKIIDFNKSKDYNSVYKSLNIQTLYYMPPEIILGNRNYNYSVDIWAIANIIYEITTSTYLFDIFNLNYEYGLHYKNYENEENIENHGNNRSDEDSGSSESSESYSDYNEDLFNNLALMHIYRSKMGDNNIKVGKYAKTFYSNDILMGCFEKTNIQKCVDLTEINMLLSKSTSNDDIIFYNKISEIFKNIFIYNYSNRLTSENFLYKFIF